jgi:dipeptidyl aminopeptidase/acylaminoacyl peptidase
MRSKYILMLSLVVIAASAGFFYFRTYTTAPAAVSTPSTSQDNPLSITAMRNGEYPGSDLAIKQTLTPGSNYRQYIASYMSGGLKIYGLLTIPDGTKPPAGWPVIIFNHGYIPPEQYRTTQRYVAYVDAFARNGYIVFKSDYRGNGSSQGQPEGAYYSAAYAVDVLNALSSVKRYKDADPNRIGMWGHSLGGNITLRDIVVNLKDIKAAVIWGGVVGSYNDLMNNWQRRVSYQPPPKELANRNNYRQNLIAAYGTPATNPGFWNTIDPTAHLADITAPVQLHTGGSDEEVPVAFSQSLYASLQKAGKTVEYYDYPGGDHNISSPNFELAMQRSIDFFNKYLK